MSTNTNIQRGLVVIALLASLLFAEQGLAQDEPSTLAYQGYLTDDEGEPTDGSQSMKFSLYPAPTGGESLWTETHSEVAVSDGLFSVQLGSVQSLGDVAFGAEMWLGIAVEGASELTPRVQLQAVPFAMGARGLRVVPFTDESQGPTLNIVQGHPGNLLGDEVFAGTISGGGVEIFPNVLAGDMGTISGGAGNTARSAGTTIGGGTANDVEGTFSTIAGGSRNEVDADNGTVGGGNNNVVSGNNGTVSGGLRNVASGGGSTVSGGNDNEVLSIQGTVSGGASNEIGTEAVAAFIGGGQNNLAGSSFAVIGGGTINKATAGFATISGGLTNEASAVGATVIGGRFNSAQGIGSTVLGGEDNRAEGDNSLAAGYRARSLHDGSFVWSDFESDNDDTFRSTAVRQFLIRARNGVGIGTNEPLGTLHVSEADIGLTGQPQSGDALIVEGEEPIIGIYGEFNNTTRPGLVLAGVNENGNVVSKWAMLREFFAGNRLLFTYGLNEDQAENAIAMSVTPSGPVAETITATEDLDDGTPLPGAHYRDNVVYAWAHVTSAGTVTSSFGCKVSKATGSGLYRVELNRQLPNGASAVVTVQTLNDPVIATAVTNANRVDVATKVFNGAAFVAADYGFYIQVVGRP